MDRDTLTWVARACATAPWQERALDGANVTLTGSRCRSARAWARRCWRQGVSLWYSGGAWAVTRAGEDAPGEGWRRIE